MRHHIGIGIVFGVCLGIGSASAQDAPAAKNASEEGLRRVLKDPQEERSEFPRVDAPNVTLKNPKPANLPYDPARPAEKLLLKDIDPSKTNYSNGAVLTTPRHLNALFKDDRTDLDVLAREILRFEGPERRPVTVVWLFDESRSMQDDRPVVRQKLERVVRDIDLVEEDFKRVAKQLGPLPEGTASEVLPISHLVGGFGKSFHLVTFAPTRNADLVQDAFERLAVDESGVENTFHAIPKAIREARQVVPASTRLLLVVVTDESGNDDDFLEDALEMALKQKVPVYVIGRQALFGMKLARLGSPAPLADEPLLPTIRRGPESPDVEVLTWDGLQPRDDEQPAGFAPYGLARLARDTGGIYFMLPSEESQRIHRREKAYSIVALRDYAPEYDSRSAYVARRDRSLLRRALNETIQATRDFSLPLRFSHEQRPLVESLEDAARKAGGQRERLISIEGKLRALRDERVVEPSRRWQAHYDLMLAQVVAFQVTLSEYQAAVLALRGTADRARGGAPAGWDVAHARAPQAPRESTNESYEEAERLLKLVIERHPGTPWADLAQTIRDRGLSVECQPGRLKDGARPSVTSSNY